MQPQAVHQLQVGHGFGERYLTPTESETWVGPFLVFKETSQMLQWLTHKSSYLTRNTLVSPQGQAYGWWEDGGIL